MLRIAHISDLHFQSQSVPEESVSILQRLGAAFGAEVRSEGHDEDKWKALTTRLDELRPDLIVVTGDLTNFGDKESLTEVQERLEKLRKETGADRVVCVPGNHDCLVDRARHLRSGFRSGLLLKAASLLSAPAAIASSLSKSLDKKITEREKEDKAAFLETYTEVFPEADPAQPVEQDARWGTVLLFPFNSNNDSDLMVNEGRIGSANYNRLNECLKGSGPAAVLVALLHHHPISAPEAELTAVEQAFNWMKDGPRFLAYLNKLGFHFVLHGHQHVAFSCSLDYSGRLADRLHLVAAGSACQGHDQRTGSFNVIDLITPFHARLRLFEYHPTGFEEASECGRELPMAPLQRFRVSLPGGERWSDDEAVRGLLRGREEGFDDTHEYSLLEFDVEITESQLYRARYRRKGRVVGPLPDAGPVFVITGSPRMRKEDMNLQGRCRREDIPRRPGVRVDEPQQKVILLPHKLELHDGDEFDLELGFEWQASAEDPNDFDALNLMYFRHPVGELAYRVTFPWEPAQPKVRGIGLSEERPELEEEALEDLGNGRFQYHFRIKEPRPLGYLIYFEPAVAHRAPDAAP